MAKIEVDIIVPARYFLSNRVGSKKETLARIADALDIPRKNVKLRSMV